MARRTWRNSVLIIGATCALAASICQRASAADQETPKQPVEYSGKMDGFIDKIIPNWHSPQATVYRTHIRVGASDIKVNFNLYNSKYTKGVIYRDNCVATPADLIVDCDLKLVDDLIDDFKLKEINDPDGTLGKLHVYKKYILAWILAHELGHVALKHGISDFDEGDKTAIVFDLATQQKELQADAYAIKVIGNLQLGPVPAYQTIMDITNSLLRKSICPATYPDVCNAMPSGVGLIYDYTENAKPIEISVYGTHPAYIARFLRILYLSGIGTRLNDINHEAKQAIEQLEVRDNNGQWVTLKEMFSHP